MNNPLSPIYPVGYRVSHFRQARRLLLATSQAAGPLWEFQWATTLGHIALVEQIKLSGAQIGNATAEELRFSLYPARSFTAVDGTNTTSILRSGNNQKLNKSNPDSVLTAFVESNAATAAAGGTLTKDTDPICTGSYVTLATATTTVPVYVKEIFNFSPLNVAEQALELRVNEGFVVTIDVTKGASQGFVLYLDITWAEARKPQ